MKTLTQIQKELKAPKNQFNKFGDYNYRSCEDILEGIKPLLSDDDIFHITDEIVMIGDRYYVKATATFNGVSVSAYAREAEDQKGMASSQVTGATSSYARKYALNGLFCIDDTKDADSQDNTKMVSSPAVTKKAQAEKLANPVVMKEKSQVLLWIEKTDDVDQLQDALSRLTLSDSIREEDKPDIGIALEEKLQYLTD